MGSSLAAAEAAGAACELCARVPGTIKLRATIAVSVSDFFTLDLSSLRNKPLCNRKWPAKTKRSRSNLKPRSRLFAFVFGPVDQQGNVAYEVQVKAIMIRNLLRAVQVLNISLQDAVKDIIGRQAVLVLLIGT